jgi:hypothetical protein
MAIPTRQQFRRSLGNSPMAREANAIYDAALRGGLNPSFVAGLAAAESSYGTAGYARGTYNPFGLGVHLGWKFPNYAAATERLGQTLREGSYRRLFQQRGLAGIISRYTPASDGNNEGQHFRNIVSYGSRAGGDPRQVYVNPGAAPAAAAPSVTGSGIDTTQLLALMRQQTQNLRSGKGYDRKLGQQVRELVISQVGEGNVGGGRVPSSAVTGGETPDGGIPAIGDQPRLSRGGAPFQGTHTIGNWQSDQAFDLFGKAGTPVRNPLQGRVVRIRGQRGGSARFAGYGVTVDYGGGRQAFYKHLGNLGPGVRVGATLPRGALIGGLDGATAGGPHLHLGATNRGFLNQLLPFYGAG